MMLITEVKSKENLAKYEADGLVLCFEKYNMGTENPFTKDELILAVEEIHRLNKAAILRVDKIIEEDEVEELSDFLDFLSYLKIDYYMFSDMFVLNYFMKRGEAGRLIYNAKTLSCSYNDCAFYNELGVKVILSNELTLEDIVSISQLPNIGLDGYGYSSIFYSKRRLVSLYKDVKKLDRELENKQMFIKEQTREQAYPILQNDQGTHIFTSYKYLFYKELENVPNMFLFHIQSKFIEEEDLLQIVSVYRKAIDEGPTEEGLDCLVAIDQNVGHSFLYKKPMILRGDDNE